MGLFSWENSHARFLSAYQKVDEEERLAELLPKASKRELRAIREAPHRGQNYWWG